MFKLLEKRLMVSWVEAPFTLFQEPIKVLGSDAIKFAQLTLCLVPKVLDSIDVILSICEQFWVVDSSVMKITYIKSIVRSECVCVNDTVRGNFFFYDGKQCSCLWVWNNSGVYTLPPRFNRPNKATLPAAPRPRFPLHVSHRSNSHQLLLPPTVHSSVAYWLWAYVKAWKKLQLYCGVNPFHFSGRSSHGSYYEHLQ